MRAVKLIIEPLVGWHIRNPATYRIERTYPVIPPTILFGIVQNLLRTSAYSTKYREIIALGGYPTSNIALSIELQRIAKMYTRKDKTGRYLHVQDRHEIEVIHSKEIESYLLISDEHFDEYFLLLSDSVGDIILLTTNQFPATVRKISEHEVIEKKDKKLLFGLTREGIGYPYVLPLRYEFKGENYRTQRYWRVLLPFVPIFSDNVIKKTDIELKEEIDVLSIDGTNFDADLVDLCKNTWHKDIKPHIGTI